MCNRVCKEEIASTCRCCKTMVLFLPEDEYSGHTSRTGVSYSIITRWYFLFFRLHASTCCSKGAGQTKHPGAPGAGKTTEFCHRLFCLVVRASAVWNFFKAILSGLRMVLWDKQAFFVASRPGFEPGPQRLMPEHQERKHQEGSVPCSISFLGRAAESRATYLSFSAVLVDGTPSKAARLRRC